MADLLSPARDAPDQGRPAQARRNRRWMLLMAMTPVVFGVLYALGVFTGGNPEPVVHPLDTPPHYSGVTDAYFGFAIPSSWKQNSAYSDAGGDFYYNGPGGWVGESEIVAKASPTPTSPVPKALQSFGTDSPTGFTLVGGHRITVPGTNFAWAVTLTRPGGFRAPAVDVWEANSQTQLWVMVHSTAAIDHTVLASLQGSLVN